MKISMKKFAGLLIATFSLLLASCGGGGGGGGPITPPPVETQPAITTASLPDPVVGIFYYETVQVTGLSGQFKTWTVSSGALPPGLLCCDATGDVNAITGYPTQTGTYSFTLKASSGTQSASKSYTINVKPNIVEITTKSLPDGDTATNYSQQIEAAHGTGGHTWTITSGSVPPGITFYSTYYSASLYGVPTKAGSYSFSVQVKDDSTTATADFTINIKTAPLKIVNSWAPTEAVNGDNYWAQFSASGGSGTKTWSVSSGSLPPGTTLNSATGGLSGQLTTTGTFPFTVRVEDESGAATYDFTLHVYDRLVIKTTALPDASVDTPYSLQLQSTGGVPPIIWTAQNLPPGITLTSDGLLSGTPGLPFHSQPFISARDSSTLGQIAYLGVPLNVNGPMVIATTELPPAIIGQSYTPEALRAFGGTTPYTWSISAGTLPSGLSLDANAGTITGTPSGSPSQSSFTVSVTDASGTQSATRDFNIRTQSSLGRNDSIATATFLSNAWYVPGSISPFADPVDLARPDQDYYRVTALGGQNASVTVDYNFLDPVVEIVDQNGVRLQTCWFTYEKKSQPCLMDKHGSNPAQTDPNMTMHFDVPGNKLTVFYVHVLDFYGDARPDLQYTLYVNVSY